MQDNPTHSASPLTPSHAEAGSTLICAARVFCLSLLLLSMFVLC